MRRIAEPWQPYRSAGTWYMWRSLGVELPENGR
jgi:3-methyladenine DNA glycosylase/8-oxoguanine DNA glycosylase